jgi:hypothetical protein
MGPDKMADAALRLHEKDSFSLWLQRSELDENLSYDRLVVKLGRHSAQLYLKSRLAIDAALTTQDQGIQRIKTFNEISKEATQQLINAISDLRLRLARQELSVGGADVHTFFGISSFGKEWAASIELRLPGLSPDGSHDADAELRARATAHVDGDIQLFGMAAAGKAVLVAGVTISATLQRASFEALVPELPILDLSFPEVDFPQLSFDMLDLGTFKPIGLNVPRWCPLHVETEVTPPLNVNVAIVNGSPTITAGSTLIKVKIDNTDVLVVNGFKFELAADKLKVAGTVSAGGKVNINKVYPIDEARFPIVGEIEIASVEIKVNGDDIAVDWVVPRFALQARNDAASRIAVALTLHTAVNGGASSTDLKDFKILDFGVGTAPHLKLGRIGDLMRINLALLPEMDQFIRRLGRLLFAAVQYMGEVASSAGKMLAELAQQAASLVADGASALLDAIAAAGELVSLELRLNPSTMQLAQVMLSPKSVTSKTLTLGGSALKLEVPSQLTPALVIDLVHGWTGLALLHDPSEHPLSAKLSTNLWFDAPGQPSNPIGGLPKQDEAPKPLLSAEVTALNKRELVLIALDHGKAKFFQTFGKERGEALTVGGVTVRSATTFDDLSDVTDLITSDDEGIKVKFDTDGLVNKLTTLMPAGASANGGLLSELTQSIKISKKNNDPISIDHGNAKLPLTIEITAGDWKANADVSATIALHSLRFALASDAIDVNTTKEQFDQDLLGLRLIAKPKEQPQLGTSWTVFKLRFEDGGCRLEKADQVDLRLRYDRLSSSGQGIELKVTKFGIGRGGLDLEAFAENTTARLAGLNQAFTFTNGSLQIQAGKPIGGTLSGKGDLPPALVGEANAEIDLVFGVRGNRFTVVSANARLKRENEPLYSSDTRFRITVDKLGLDFKDVAGGQQHFYFLLWGEASFEPRGDEFSSGLLSRLRSVAIKLDAVPLTGDASELLKHIEFQAEISPPLKASLFDIFDFEVRGIGFHPSSDLWPDRPPAMAISGQVSFLDAGDAISSEIDFHRIWITRPDPKSNGSPLPRVRADGLSVLLRVGGVAQVEATAVAVDGKLPSLYTQTALPDEITAQGFLASGRIDIKGLGAYGAALGFLELSKEGIAQKKHAMFLYGQGEKLSERIDTPVGPLFIREAGLAVTRNYALAAMDAADHATTPGAMVKALDEVVKIQGNLMDFRAWQPQYDNDNITLALRGMISLTSASTRQKYNEKGEKSLSNPLLINLVLGMRTDMTVFATATAHIAWNYHDWQSSATSAPWKAKPSLIGYLYFSVPRRELLARFISNPGGEVGEHPKLPKPLKDALAAVRYSATMYIRPGLYHVEFGWPYELGFNLGKPGDTFWLNVRGGLVHRIEDATALYGLAMRAVGGMRLGGSVGGSSFGASAVAEANFAIEAKFIAFIDAFQPDNTIFYGSVYLNLTLDIRVSVWMSFRVFRARISISISFTISLTISIAAEVVVGGEGIGARVHAAVGVSGFGRTLSVGVGFAFGADKLDSARARVARFLDLGLGADIPKGDAVYAPPPAAEVPRKQRSAAADNALDTAPTAVPPSEEEKLPEEYTPIRGRPIPATEWLAMLFDAGTDTVSGERQYVLQLIPRDDQEQTDVQRSAMVDFGFLAEPLISTELCKPDTAKADYKVANFKGKRFAENTGPDPFTTGDVWSAANKEIQKNPERSIRMNDLIRECFLDAPDASAEPIDLKAAELLRCGEPLPIRHKTVAGVDTPEAESLASQWTRNGQGIAAELIKFKASLAAEERRSALVNLIGETAFKMAKQARERGQANPWQRSSDVLQARDFGLTFLVTAGELEKNFPVGDNRKCTFTVEKRIWRNNQWEYGTDNVVLFCHPSAGFQNTKPRGENSRALLDSDGIKLYWDFKYGEGQSGNPESQLVYYEIERVFSGGDKAWVHTFTSRSATAVKYKMEGDRIVASRSLAEMHLKDDLTQGGVPDDVRALILGTPIPSGRTPKQVWTQYFGRGAEPSVSYKVVAVDQLGNESRWVIDDTPIKAPIMPVEAPTRSELSVSYARQPTLAAPQRPVMVLGLTFGSKAEVEIAMHASFLLRARASHLRGGGQFGADALDAGKNRPSQAEIEMRQPALDMDIVLRPAKGSEPYIKLVFKAPDLEDISVDFAIQNSPSDSAAAADAEARLRDALRIPDGSANIEKLRATRVFVRRLVSEEERKEAWRESSWNAVELLMRIDASSGGTTYAAVVEALEYPLGLTLPALPASQIEPDAGRLEWLYPSPNATLADLLRSGNGIVPQLDREGRLAMRLTVNAYGAEMNNVPREKLALVVGGLDVMKVDPIRIRQMENLTAGAVAEISQPVSTVQILPRSLAGHVPDSVNDFKSLKVRYPSDTVRDGPDRPGWFSRADSLVAFARPVLRRGLLTAPDEALISTLLDRADVTDITIELKTADVLVSGLSPELETLRNEINLGLKGLWLELDGQRSRVVHVTAKDDKTPISASLLRAKLRRLTTHAYQDLDKQYLEWRKLGSDSALAAGFEIALEIKRAKVSAGVIGVSETVEINLATGLHPILAETLDELRYANMDDVAGFAGAAEVATDGRKYRAYEPVLEAHPALGNAGYDAFLDAYPPTTDPYGWAVLRAMGLATGLRVYVIDQAEYLSGKELLSHLDGAFSSAIERYTDIDHGSPFVELVDPADDFRIVSSFDGRDGAKDAAAPILEGRTSIVQLSLRPRPAQFAGSVGDRVVRYFVLTRNADHQTDEDEVKQPLLSIPAAIFDLKDLCGLFRSGLSEAWSPHVPIAEFLFPGQGNQHLLPPSFNVRPVMHLHQGTRVAFVRVVTPAGHDEQAAPIYLKAALRGLVDVTEASDAFDVFPPLPGRALALIESESSAQGTSPFTLFRANLPPKHLLSLPIEPADIAAMLQRQAGWSERFLRHGSSQTSAGGDKLRFALASMGAETIRARIPDVNGQISILIDQPSRNGYEMLFAVRPFGRYEALGAQLSGKVHKPTLAGSLNADWKQHFVGITLPRTRPALMPAILSAALVSTKTPDKSREMEIIIARTPDQKVSVANIPGESALQPAWTGLELRRFLVPESLARARKVLADIVYDGLDRMGTTSIVSEGEIIVPRQLDSVADKVPDAWGGVVRYGIQSLPYFYRIVGLAHQSAGVIVSDVAGRVLPRADHTLRLPPGATPDPAHDGEVWKAKARPPTWRLRRALTDKWEGQQIVGKYEELFVEFNLPLVRHLDMMEYGDVRAWTDNKANNAPVVFRLPDSEATYRIETLSKDLTSLTTLLEIMPAKAAEPSAIPENEPNSNHLYVGVPAGDRFLSASQEVSIIATDKNGKEIPITEDTSDRRQAWNWILPMTAKAGRADADRPFPDIKAVAEEIGVIENFQGFDARKWQKWSPRRSVEVFVNGAPTDNDVRVELTALLSSLQPFSADLGAAKIAGDLRAVLDSAETPDPTKPVTRGRLPLGPDFRTGSNLKVTVNWVTGFAWLPKEEDEEEPKDKVETFADWVDTVALITAAYSTMEPRNKALGLADMLLDRWLEKWRGGFAGKASIYRSTKIMGIAKVDAPFTHSRTHVFTFSEGFDKRGVIVAICKKLGELSGDNRYALAMAIAALRPLLSPNAHLDSVKTIRVPVAVNIGAVVVPGVAETLLDEWTLGLHLPPQREELKTLPDDLTAAFEEIATAQIFGDHATPRYTAFHSDKTPKHVAIQPEREIWP